MRLANLTQALDAPESAPETDAEPRAVSVTGEKRRGWVAPLLGSLVLVTCLAVGSVSYWLIPPYLVMMSVLLADFLPKSLLTLLLPGRRVIATNPVGEAEEAEERSSLADGPEHSRSEADTAQEIPAEDQPIEAPIPSATKPKRARGRSRKARPATIEPAPATWIQVAPGKFVRVEGPGPETPPSPRLDGPTPPEPAEDGNLDNSPQESGGDPQPEDSQHFDADNAESLLEATDLVESENPDLSTASDPETDWEPEPSPETTEPLDTSLDTTEFSNDSTCGDQSEAEAWEEEAVAETLDEQSDPSESFEPASALDLSEPDAFEADEPATLDSDQEPESHEPFDPADEAETLEVECEQESLEASEWVDADLELSGTGLGSGALVLETVDSDDEEVLEDSVEATATVEVLVQESGPSEDYSDATTESPDIDSLPLDDSGGPITEELPAESADPWIESVDSTVIRRSVASAASRELSSHRLRGNLSRQERPRPQRSVRRPRARGRSARVRRRRLRAFPPRSPPASRLSQRLRRDRL